MATDLNLIKGFLVDRLNASACNLKEIADYPKDSFTGYPAACLFCSGNENEYASNTENMRIWAFELYIFVDVTRKVTDPNFADDNAKDQAERLLGDAVSDVLDSLDQYYDPQQNLDSTFEFLEAIPSAWEYVKTGIGLCRVAKITIKVHKYFNI
jgi:hypothetical protein